MYYPHTHVALQFTATSRSFIPALGICDDILLGNATS